MEEQANEQPIVEITKQPDYKAYRKFYWFSARYRPMAWIIWLAPVLLSMPNIVWNGPDWVHTWQQENIIELSFPLFIIVPFIVLFIVIATAPRRLFNRNKKSRPLETTTAFFESQFTYSATSQNRSDSGCVGYESVNKAYETRDAFYLKYEDKHWSFFPKKFFAPGQAAILRALFTCKFGEKFKMKL